jgi:hypothetical protein
MHCTICGAQLADTAKFCHVCGAAVTRAVPPPAVTSPSPPPATRIPRRLLGCGAALLSVFLLVGLILVAAYFLLGLHRDSGIAELTPDNAAAVVVIRPSLLQLNQLRDTDRLMGSAAALAPLVAAPGVINFVFGVYADYGEALQNVDINPTEDVLPWIGREVALAAGPDGNGIVAVAAVRNETRAIAFLTDLREKMEDEGIEFDESDHHGVAVTEVVGPEFYTPLAFAVADGRMLLASNREVLGDALERAESGRKTLADNDAFRDALAAQPANRIGMIYIDPGVLGDDVEALDALRWIGGAAALTGNGTRISYRLGFDRDALDADQREWLERGGIDNRLAARIPADTLFYMAGGSLAEALDNAAAQSPNFEDALEEIQTDSGLSGLYDLLEMMTGEFALAVTRDDEGLLAELSGEPFGLLIASQVEDGGDAQDELENIFEGIARDTDSRFETDEVDEAVVGYLENEFVSGGGFLGYGVAGDDMLLATSGALVEDALETGGGLADDARFQATLDALPSGGLLYLYFDADAINRLVDSLGIDAETSETYTERIEAIGLVAEPMSRDGEINLELFFLTEWPR